MEEREVLPLLRAMAARLDAIEARLSALERRSLAAPPRKEGGEAGEQVRVRREGRMSWALFGLIAVAVLVGVLLATRGGSPGGTLSGTVTVAEAVRAKVAPSDVLFLIARSSAGGPPLAVRRIAKPAFPLAYSLSQADVMIPDLVFRGEVYVTARLSKSGDAAARPGDLAGAYQGNPAKVGAMHADIVMDRVL